MNSSLLVVTRGILSVILGIALIVWPQPGLLAIALLFGAYAFTDGVLAVLSAFRRTTRSWSLPLMEGGVGITTGIVTFFWPAITLIVLTIFLGAWALTTGCLEILAAIRLQDFFPRAGRLARVLLLAAGLASVTLGAYIFSTPKIGLATLLVLASTYALVFGCLMIFHGVRLSRARHEEQPERKPEELRKAA